MTYDVDLAEMRQYVIGKFKAEGDFEFLKEGMLDKLVDALMAFDAAYMSKLTDDDDYDDDDAYELIFAGMKEQFPDYKMYAMRLAEDYLDFAEEYLASVDAIEWE